MKWMKEILVLLCNFVQIYWFDMIVWIILIALIILCVRLVRAIFSRFLFIARLKKITKKNAIELKICRFPLLSLFLFSAGIDIEINTTNQFFNVSFCPGYVLRKNVYIFSENKIYYSNIRAKSFWGNKNLGGSPSLVSVEEKDKKEVPLKIPFTDQKQNILIFEPAPIGLFVYRGNGYLRSGSGDSVGRLLIYEGKDFTNYIERNYQGGH